MYWLSQFAVDDALGRRRVVVADLGLVVLVMADLDLVVVFFTIVLARFADSPTEHALDWA